MAPSDEYAGNRDRRRGMPGGFFAPMSPDLLARYCELMGNIWTSMSSGGRYAVVAICRGAGKLRGDYTVDYIDLNDGARYSRLLSEWYDRMEILP